MTTIKQNTFNSKEDYLNFRKAWACAVNDERAKKHYEERLITTWNGRERYVQKVKLDGWLSAYHHILFNRLCGRKPHIGFKPITRPNCLRNGHAYNYTYWWACKQFNTLVGQCKAMQAGTASKMQEEHVEAALKPIQTFTDLNLIEIIAGLDDVPAVLVESCWGAGYKIRNDVIDKKIILNSMEDLFTAIDKKEAA